MSLLVWSWPCKIVSTYVFCVMLSHSFCCGTCMCTWSVLEKSVFFCCVCYFVWPRKYFGHIMLWVCCCQSVHNIICVLVDHDQSWIIDMELRLVLILCIVARPVSKQQTPICKNECYYFSYSWTKTVPITWHLSSGNFAFWSSREPLGQIGSTLMWYSLGGLMPKCVWRHCPTSKMMP